MVYESFFFSYRFPYNILWYRIVLWYRIFCVASHGKWQFFPKTNTFFFRFKVLWRDPREGGASWRHLTQLPAKSFNQCVAVMDGFLYVAGGEDQNDARNQAKHAVSTLSRSGPRHGNDVTQCSAVFTIKNCSIFYQIQQFFPNFSF